MFDNSKCLSQNPLQKSMYVGKDVGLLKDRIFFEKYRIEDDIIIGENLKSEKPKNNYYKLSSVYNYLVALSNTKRKNDFEKCIELFKCIGVPARCSLDKNNKFIAFNVLDIDSSIIQSTINSFKQLSTISATNSSLKKFLSNKPISFVTITSPTLLTEFISIISSSNIFGLAAYYYTKIQPFSINDCFICSECGNVYIKESNKIRFCKCCKEKIDFPKISHNKKRNRQ